MYNMAPCGLRFFISKIYRLLSSQMHWPQHGVLRIDYLYIKDDPLVPFRSARVKPSSVLLRLLVLWSHFVLSKRHASKNSAVSSTDPNFGYFLTFPQCCGSGSLCFCASRIRKYEIRLRLRSGFESFYHQAKTVNKISLRLFIFEKRCNCSFKM
jgi:hypothetical protein